MTNKTVEIKESRADAPIEVVISEARPKGWMAFYRQNNSCNFTSLYPIDYTNRDWFMCPSPLFETREDAIKEISRYAKGQGGEARIVLVTL